MEVNTRSLPARPARLRLLGVAFAVTFAFIAIAGCGSSGSTDPASPTNGATSNSSIAANGATPNVSPQGAEASTTVADAPQTAVVGKVIDTPPGLVTTAPANAALLNDYKLAPADRSLVLTAAVPRVDIYDSATSTTPIRELANPIDSGAPLTFLVDGLTSTRYKVLLPIRPNGATGWINPAQVSVLAHQYKITVELAAHKITVTNGSSVVMSEPIGVGKDATPTPNGRYYIKELIRPCYPDAKGVCVANDNGPYGPFAYGLSGFSPVLDDYNGKGEGTIGIHGTDNPDSVGKDASHGCIRMRNDAIRQLAKILPLGTPVIVKA